MIENIARAAAVGGQFVAPASHAFEDPIISTWSVNIFADAECAILLVFQLIVSRGVLFRLSPPIFQVVKENRSRYATTGLGLTSRVVGTDPSFKRLDTNSARRAYG